MCIPRCLRCGVGRLTQSQRWEPVRFGAGNFRLRDLPFQTTPLAVTALLAEKIAPSTNDGFDRGKARDERGDLDLNLNSNMVPIGLNVMCIVDLLRVLP